MPLGLLCVEMIHYCKSHTKKDQQERKCSFRDQVQEFDRDYQSMVYMEKYYMMDLQ